jgi:hypothetical protein
VLQTPVYNLLGGRVRDTIPLSHSIPWGSPEEMAAMVRNKPPPLLNFPVKNEMVCQDRLGTSVRESLNRRLMAFHTGAKNATFCAIYI